MKNKPNLLLFQQQYNQKSTKFIINQQNDHVKCLSYFFNVNLINVDCDYQEICEKYEPDLSLFESGVNLPGSRRIIISNTQACKKVPKLGFHNADSWSDANSGFLSDMDHWGIENFFSICVTTGEHIPAIAQNLFVWPNFIDSEIYRDYDQAKIIPVLLTGCKNELYPWRDKIYKILSNSYPSLVCPHFGYLSNSRVGQTIWGEQYARTINASWFAPTCGTIAKEVVRKHFEIPGCKACLITEESPGLRAAGFIDMQNCIFADEKNVIDKLTYLFEKPEKLQEITRNGFQLVHSRHTMLQRDQIYQWFSLNKNLKPHQKIVQTNPFQPLTVVEKTSEINNIQIISRGTHLELLSQANNMLFIGNYNNAENLYLKCLTNMNQSSEPKVGIALCNLYLGNPKIALSWIIQPIRYTLTGYKAIDPDPVEWAYFIICLLCLGKLKQATKRARQFPWLHHPELDRIRWCLAVLEKKENISLSPQDYNFKNRCSIHQLPNRNFNEWLHQTFLMLKTCKQFAIADRLKTKLSSVECLFHNQELVNKTLINHSLWQGNNTFLNKKVTLKFLDNPLFLSRIISRIFDIALSLLHKLEVKFGDFLPYHLSHKKDVEFFSLVQKLMREENIKTALIIGANMRKGSTEAFFAGLEENKNKISVFCISFFRQKFKEQSKKFNNFYVFTCDEQLSSSVNNDQEEFNKLFRAIKENNFVNFFDAILIDGSELPIKSNFSKKVNKHLQGAKLFILDDLYNLYTYQCLNSLLEDSNYDLHYYNQCSNHSNAIFKNNSII